jgi:hypothetical protein
VVLLTSIHETLSLRKNIHVGQLSISVSVCKVLLVIRIEYSSWGMLSWFRPSSSKRSLWNKVNQQVQSGLFYHTKLNCNFGFYINQVHGLLFFKSGYFSKGVDCRFVNWDNRFLTCVV